MAPQLPSLESTLPKHRDLFYNGQWQAPESGIYQETYNPGTGKVVCQVAQANANDVDAAVTAAHEAFENNWSLLPLVQRMIVLRKAAAVIRQHADELGFLDALNTGNPVTEMVKDVHGAAFVLEYFAGLSPMIKGETIPYAAQSLHYTVREPFGVVARIIAFNHPILFAVGKMAAPLAAGNTVIIKCPDQAPLSCLRLAEILEDILPPGVLSILPGTGVDCGTALSIHPLVKKVTLVGSVTAGKAVQRAAADSLKPTLLELGGKNALLAFPDADIDKLVEGVTTGMNFTWAGQSCGSTSRVFLHESHHDQVVQRVVDAVNERYKAGVPTDSSTTMGPVVSRAAYDRVLSYIESGKQEGAILAAGGGPPTNIDGIEGGYFIEPTIFTNVKPNMRIAKEEIFGPVLSILKWSGDEKDVIRQVNDTSYGLTASIYTKDLATAQRAVSKIQAGYVWVNTVAKHFFGVPFGGYKESGMGREECLDELLSFTQIKSVNISLE